MQASASSSSPAARLGTKPDAGAAAARGGGPAGVQAALSEHSRHVRHEREAAQMAAQRRAEEESHAAGASDDAAAAAATPKRDMSIKDGQTIRVSLVRARELAAPLRARWPAPL
eukprot:scaffold4370_cov317-Prasinococcus_capsulatus_cf.AAC.6